MPDTVLRYKRSERFGKHDDSDCGIVIFMHDDVRNLGENEGTCDNAVDFFGAVFAACLYGKVVSIHCIVDCRGGT